jgi:hypothetical protein
MKFIVIVAAICLLLPAVAQAAPSGTITGGTVDTTWTRGHVDNVSVTFDLASPNGVATKWAGIAQVQPAALGSCPTDWIRSSLSNGVVNDAWFSGYIGNVSPTSAVSTTISSGPFDFPISNGALGQRLCLYYLMFPGTAYEQGKLVAEKVLMVSPNVESPTIRSSPIPATDLSHTEAWGTVNWYFDHKFKSFHHAKKRSIVEYKQINAAKRVMIVNWLYKSQKYRKIVVVVKTGGKRYLTILLPNADLI